MWIAEDWKDYELLDCGGGEKLERWDKQFLVRPDPQAIWETPRKNPAAIKAPFPLRSPLLPLSYQICAAIARELSYSASQDVIFRWSGTRR